jgi:hypothetical protein
MDIIITHQIDAGETKTWRFDGTTPVRIGRSDQNDVVLNGPGDRSVSGKHAEIRLEAGQLIIKDRHSTNGIWIDGIRVETAKLFCGMEILLGAEGPSFKVDIEGNLPAPTIPISPQVPKKYGERTVGMMIQKALAQAGLVRPSGTSKSTKYFEALVERRFKQTSARVKWIIAAAAVLVLIGAGIGIYFYSTRSIQYIQTTQVNYGDAAGTTVAAANRYAIFLLAGVARDTGIYQGFCTAFAVTPTVLATNAHCVKTGEQRFLNPVAIMNGVEGRAFAIRKMLSHPEYRDGTISPDIGLVFIHEALSQTVRFATNEELAQVVPGAPMFLYGFPGRLNKVEAPEATFVKGEIGRVTGMDQKPSTFAGNTLLQHSAFSSAGTSGSPIFNTNGHVIGLNAGGYTEDGQVLTGYNFGMRIDLIYPLIRSVQ